MYLYQSNYKALSTGCLKWVLQSSCVKILEGYQVQGTSTFTYLRTRTSEKTTLWSGSFFNTGNTFELFLNLNSQLSNSSWNIVR